MSHSSVVDDARDDVYDEVDSSRFSRNGGRFAYTAEVAKKWTVVVDGESQIVEGKPAGSGFDAVTWPVFFGESRKRVAYAVADVGHQFGGGAKGTGPVILDGVAGPDHEGKSTKSLGEFWMSCPATTRRTGSRRESCPCAPCATESRCRG